MRNTFTYLRITLLTIAAFLYLPGALAWDSVGHRLSAAVALHYMSEELRPDLLGILQQHPRYQQDFIDQMPASVARGSEADQLEWLLGQAAFWPDSVRGLPETDRDRYNRARWHYIDGAWLRGQANVQGNTYIGTAPFPDIAGQHAQDEADADDVMTALDYNTALLADERMPGPRRAVALCWVLHLIGDIHQPLHTGSLYSATRFANGDRGGNGIETDEGNLHARWDRALRSEGVSQSLAAVMTQHAETLARMEDTDDGDWSLWMHESRALLLNTVYTEQMKAEIARSDASAGALPEFTLEVNYVRSMKYHAGMRLALAGRRLALWFDENL